MSVPPPSSTTPPPSPPRPRSSPDVQITQQPTTRRVSWEANRDQIVRTEETSCADRVMDICGEILTCCGFCTCEGDRILREAISLQNERTATEYQTAGIAAYIKHGHGTDGKQLLDPIIEEFITRRYLLGPLLDAGCDGGDWVIYAAKLNMEVYGNDIQGGMIQAAQQRATEQGLTDRVHLMPGDATNMAVYSDAFFRTALSVLVGCNLAKEDLLRSHIQELVRVVDTSGKVLFVAPESLDKVFTDGKKALDDVTSELEVALRTFNTNRTTPPSLEEVRGCLSPMSNILSATFVVRGNTLVHVSDASVLEVGEAIFRKLPDNVIPNHYYPIELYEDFFAEYKLKVVKAWHRLISKADREAHNQLAGTKGGHLGSEYEEHSIFAAWELQKLPIVQFRIAYV